MRKKLPIVPFLYFLAFFPKLSLAQNIQQDSSFRQAAINNLISLYHQTVGHSSNLYNGTEYDAYPYPFEGGHQYFGTGSFTNGYVHYNGVLYSNVPLRYDIVRDELVLLHWDSIHSITLVKEKVDSFLIAGHRFVRIQDSVQKGLSEGYFEQLHAGKVSLIAKHTKNLQEIIDNRTVLSKVSYRRRIYLQKEGAFYPVKNKKSLFHVLSDQRSGLQKYVKQQKINLKRNATGGMTRVVAYYNELIQ